MSAAARPASHADLLAKAAALCADAGLPAPEALDQLTGGRNNRVFRLRSAAGRQLVLKSYFRHANDPRDRVGAEWDYLTFAWGQGVRCVPEPVACDFDAGLSLLGFVDGAKLAPEAIGAAHVGAAAEFICAVNAGPRPADGLRPGSEACFSIADHLARVDRRVAQLGALDPKAPLIDAATAFVVDVLMPHWRAVRAAIVAQCETEGLAVDVPIDEAQIIASPSDFGFHNALWHDDTGLSFLDFEYAGLDDPAKLVGDFFSCPEIPTPGKYFDMFTETLGQRLALGRSALARMRMLRDAYRTKWACIVLNDFLPHHDARRRFAEQGGRKARCAVQLDKAAALINGTKPRTGASAPCI